MAGAFLYENKVAAGVTLTATTAAAPTMPVGNLLDPQPRMRARFLGGSAGILVDLLSSTALECLALISTNATAEAIVRWRMGPAEALVEEVPERDLDWRSETSFAAPAGYTFARADAATVATRWNAAGNLEAVAANLPRYDYDPATLAYRGLLLEGARTNSVRNAAALGAVPGTPGTLPTNWTLFNAAGLSSQVVGVGTDRGIPYCDIRLFGTPSATGLAQIYLEQIANTVASTNTWVASAFVGLGGGSLVNVGAVSLIVAEWTAAAAFIGQTPGAGLAPTTASLATQRATVARTMTGPSTGRVNAILSVAVTNGLAVNVTLRIGAPQLEYADFNSNASSPIIGATVAAATRAADDARLALDTWWNDAGGAVVVEYFDPLSGATPNVRALWGATDGSANNRICAFMPVSVAAPRANIANGGTNYQTATTPGHASAAANRFAMAWQVAASGMVAAENAGAAQLATPGAVPAAAVLTAGIRLGGMQSLTAGPLFGHLQRWRYFPQRLGNNQITGLALLGSSLDGAQLTYDSGALAATTSADCNGNVVLLPETPAAGRYLQVDLADATLATVDVGLLVAGPLWRLARSHGYGIEEGRLMLDRRERNAFTGAEFPAPAVANPRSARFTLPMMTTAEARGAHRNLVARLGAAGDALWIPSLVLSQAELNARSLWGAVNAPGDTAAATMQRLNVQARSLAMVERL